MLLARRIIYSFFLIPFLSAAANAEQLEYWSAFGSGNQPTADLACQNGAWDVHTACGAGGWESPTRRSCLGINVNDTTSTCGNATWNPFDAFVTYIDCPAGSQLEFPEGGDPTCGEVINCPSGTTPSVITVGGNDVTTCEPDIWPPEACTVYGYKTNSPMCQEQRDDCQAQGGAFGVFNNQPICVPPQDPEPNVPDCGNEGIAVISSDGTSQCQPLENLPRDLEGIGNSGEESSDGDGTGDGAGNDSDGPPVITVQVDTDGDGTPNVGDPDIDGDGISNGSDPDVDGDGVLNENDSDIDGDGTPNSSDGDMDGDGLSNGEDGDIDGDGVNNGSDGDADGDGIDNGDDSQPFGDSEDEGTEEEVSVQGGGSCAAEARPQCSGGDPVLCAVLVQTWATRCALEGPDDYPDDLDQYDSGDLTTEEDAASYFGDVFTAPNITASCPAPQTLSVAGTNLTIEYTPFCDLANLIRPIVLFLFSLIAFRVVMRGFQ